MGVSVTYFLEIQSSWCFWAEPAWAELKERFAGQVDFSWEIALMPPEAVPATKAECAAAYRRSGTVMRSDSMLNADWFEEELQGDYNAANWVAEAGKGFGIKDDRLRLALSRAALVHGRKIGRMDEAVAVAVEACDLEEKSLKEAARSDAVQKRTAASTARFAAHQLDQRPAFIIESAIGDKAVFSGIVRPEPLSAAIEAMLHDARAYASFHAHFGAP